MQQHVPLSQFALLWVMHQDGITYPIIDPHTMEQFEDCLEVLGKDLPEDLDQRARELTADFAWRGRCRHGTQDRGRCKRAEGSPF